MLKEKAQKAYCTDSIIEKLAEAVHKAYCAEYEIQHGEVYWTHGDYSLLDEDTKELDRATVRAVLLELT